MLSKLIFLPVKSRPILTASLSIFGFLLAGTAMAQTVPGTADVSRVQGHIEQTLPRGKAEAPLKVEGSAPFTAPDGAEKMLFTLQSVEIEGQTVYPQAKLEKLYASKVGTQISLADVYALAAQLTAQYRNDGYILTQVVVPPKPSLAESLNCV
ncbi:MAG TPA: POTRA domain-containing protein [Alphaproteobacteria bacterium]|nr:POTRA domain-containing protein [Alphaproteobacteria bacterium]